MIDAADGSASPSLDGFYYQADVSSWIALDFLVAKRLADRVTLEPAGQEDLEADLLDERSASAASDVDLGSYRLIIQAKLRNTGPWNLTALKDLVEHGVRRKPAKTRLLEDADARYLLVTSAALQGDAMKIGVSQLAVWPKANNPPSLGLVGADGRLAVLSGEDDFKVQRHIRELLEDAFKVPHINFEQARKDLQAQTLDRMRRGADWTRDALEALIRKHGGQIASSPEVAKFVPPLNWSDALGILDQQHAVILSGPSGTGKTLAASVLAAYAKDQDPAAAVIEVTHPRQIRSHQAMGSVIFMIEDPWGKYQVHPDADVWTHELPRMLATADGNRRMIVTSRTDIIKATEAGTGLQNRWSFKLEPGQYGTDERSQIFDKLLQALPRHLHATALEARADVISDLNTPLELENFFSRMDGGPEPKEVRHVFIRRCIKQAGADGLEAAAAAQIKTHAAPAEAATMWALLKARPKLSRGWLPQLAEELGDVDPVLADRLEWWVNIQVSGEGLRQATGANADRGHCGRCTHGDHRR